MRKNLGAAALGLPIALAAALTIAPWTHAGEEPHSREPRAQRQPPAPTGTIVIRTAQESDFPSLAKVSLQQAIQIALQQTPGGLLKAETEEEHGFLVHHLEVVGPEKVIVEFTIEAGTGAILRQSIDQPDDDQDDEHEDGEDED